MKSFGKTMGQATARYAAAVGSLVSAAARVSSRPSELQLRATFDHAAVGIAHTAPDGTYLRVNRKLCEMLGYKPDELVGRTYKDITYADDRGFQPTLRSRLTGNPDPAASLQLEKRYLKKGGSTIWANVSISLVCNAAGEPDYFVSIVQDISERKAAEERFRATFEQAAVGIVHTGLDGRYLHVNGKFCEILGYRVDEMLALNADAQMNDEERAVDARLRAELIDGKRESFSYAGHYLHKNGTALWVNHTVSLARDAAHNPPYFIRVVEDISARKRTEERVQQLNRAQRMSSECRRALARSYDEAELLDALCRIVVETGGYRQAWIGFAVDDPHKSLRVAAYAGFEDTTPRVEGATWGERKNPEYHGVMGQVIASGQRRLVQHIGDDPAHAARRARALERGYASSLTLPLWNDQRCYGAIAIYAREADAFDSAELKLLEELTDDISRGITGLRDKRVREEAETASREHEAAFREREEHFGLMISERKQTEAALYESETQFRQLAENIPQMFWITDVAHRALVYLSPAFETITGHKVSEAKASSRLLVAVVHPDDRRRVQMARKHAAEGGYDETYRLMRPDGSIRWVRDRAFPIRDADGQVYRVAGIAEDITERKQAEQTMVHLAHYDALTKLPNRVLCQDRLKQALAHAKRNNWCAAVMFVDLDRFKNVNDTLGHHVGDTLLQQASERLGKCVRAGDTVGRFGGDEYVVILSDLSGPGDATVVAQKISNAFALPFVLDGKQIYITASIGISMYPADSKDQDELIRNADTAMYCAKERGRNNFQFYEPSMNARALEKLNLENDLRRALENSEFRLHYQPKASLATGLITGFEALLRWQHPDRGLVSPGDFIPLLEETGLIVQAGEWVIRETCRQIKAWRDAGVKPVPIAVNLAARQFQSSDLGASIVGVLAEFGIEPGLLELEITESSLMQNTMQAVETLKYLQSHGLCTSIDDFGTGYSSLAYLKRFPLYALKIDRTFVRDIGEDSDDTAITLALINMAHNLGLKVIAEGVETEAQLTFLAAHGCDEMQGYYFSKALTDADATDFLKEKRALPQSLQSRSLRDTVLLVDDDEDTLMLIQRTLRDEDYDVLVANNAQQGLDLLAKHNVKVVVSDQEMPGMNGVAFLERVKSVFPSTMRIMLSAHTEFETVADALNMGGIYRFVAKSAAKDELRRAIREALETCERLNRGRAVTLREKRSTTV